MQTAAYSPSQIYPITVEVGHVFAVTFSKDEVATDGWGSNSDALKVDLSGNLAIYKAQKPFSPRSYFIKTRRADGSTRLYAFQVTGVEEPAPSSTSVYESAALGADPPPAQDTNMYDLQFTYPADELAEKKAAAAKRQEEWEKRRVQTILAQAASPDPNYRYALQGATASDWDLLPSRSVYDDNSNTYFSFPGEMRIPVIYVVNPDGKEAVVNYTFDSATGIATVHQLAAHWMLRDGNSLLCVFNKAYNPVPDKNTSGTSSPNVMRVVR